MTELLTPEKVLEISEEWKKMLLANLPVDELDAYIASEYKEMLMNQGIEQGIEQGKKSERINQVLKLLERRFDAVPDDIRDTLAQCTLDQLDALVDPAFDAPDFDTFLIHMPKSEPVSKDELRDGTGSNTGADA